MHWPHQHFELLILSTEFFFFFYSLTAQETPTVLFSYGLSTIFMKTERLRTGQLLPDQVLGTRKGIDISVELVRKGWYNILKVYPPPRKKILLHILKNEPPISTDFENFTPSLNTVPLSHK